MILFHFLWEIDIYKEKIGHSVVIQLRLFIRIEFTDFNQIITIILKI